MGKITDPVSQEAKRRQDNLYEALGSRVQSWRTHLPTDMSKAQCDIEDELGLSKGRIGKIESASSATPSLYELAQLSKAMGITCDELITGISPQYMELCDKTGLSGKAIQCLERYNQSYPDYIKMLNGILEDDAIATLLLDTFLLYANYELLEIKVGEVDHEFPIGLESEQQQGLHRSLANYYLQIVLEKVRQDWQTDIGTMRMEKAATKALESVKLSIVERLQRMENYKRHVDKQIDETERRDNGED